MKMVEKIRDEKSDKKKEMYNIKMAEIRTFILVCSNRVGYIIPTRG